jgi:predicted thioesterase
MEPLSPGLFGQKEMVRAESRLTEISGRKLTFDVVVYDPNEKIAEGVNELLIVSSYKFLEKVKRKL